VNFKARRKKILVVDDHQELLLLYRMRLGQEYEVVTALDGKEALERAAVDRPDLILMDIMMPRMNGLEACRRIRALPATRSVPIVLATSNRRKAIRQEAWESGCDDFLTKPTDWPELFNRIRAHLRPRTDSEKAPTEAYDAPARALTTLKVLVGEP
jgi:CheY-like chemotaxis protein